MRLRKMVTLGLLTGGIFMGIPSRAVQAVPTAVSSPVPAIVADAGARVEPTDANASGERARQLVAQKPARRMSAYDRWKMRLSFWPRKAVTFAELALVIMAGVIIGQMLEELGVVRALGFVTWPITALGRLPRETGPAFLFAFQSGAIANSMLVNLRDNGVLDRRGLYASIFVVSNLSLFAHLPTFIVPLGMSFGWEATGALFSVRFAAIFTQIAVVLLVSRLLTRWRPRVAGVVPEGAVAHAAVASSPAHPRAPGRFVSRVWGRSWKTIRRLLIYLAPTFVITATLEQSNFFNWLAARMPGLFAVGGLPPESAAVIGAQAVNLYNGAIMAASFVDSGALDVRRAILILLTGTLVTAPVRTLKHSLATYIAVLGPRAGATMAVLTQVVRSIFLLVFIVLLAMVWR